MAFSTEELKQISDELKLHVQSALTEGGVIAGKVGAEVSRVEKRINWSRVWSIGRWVLLALFLIALAAFLYARFKPSPVITQEHFAPTPEMKPLQGVTKVMVQAPKVIYVYPPAAVAGAVPQLSQEIAKIPEAKTLTSATLPESKNGYDSAAVMDAKGDTIILSKEKTSPLFQLRNDLTAGLRGGLIAGSNITTPYGGDVHVEWKFLRMKNMKLGAYGEAGVMGTQGYGKAMLSADFDVN
jgi:hypothetical protein